MGKTETEQPPSQGFTGTVSQQLSDLLQMFCLSRGDLLVRVTSVEGTGTIYVHAGQIQHAHTEGMEGEAAFFEILSWRDGHFEMLPYYDLSAPFEPFCPELAAHYDVLRFAYEWQFVGGQVTGSSVRVPAGTR